MSFRLKPDVNVLELLRLNGYTTYKLRRDKIMGESTLQKIRDGRLPSWNELDTICRLAGVAPWDIIEFREGE